MLQKDKVNPPLITIAFYAIAKDMLIEHGAQDPDAPEAAKTKLKEIMFKLDELSIRALEQGEFYEC